MDFDRCQNHVPSSCLETNEDCYQQYIFCLSNITELRPWSHADCSMEFENIIHLYGTSCQNICDNKISTAVGYHVMLAALLFSSQKYMCFS